MNGKRALFFIAVALSLNGEAVCSVPLTALYVEFDKLKVEIDEADLDQDVRDRAVQLWALAQAVAVNLNHSTPTKMKQLEIVKCMLQLEFPEEEKAEPIAIVDGIGALLAEGSTAPDKPVKRDRPEVDPPAAGCKIEILKLNTNADVFEVAPSRVRLDGPRRNVFLSARTSEPGTVEWSEVRLITLVTGISEESFPLPGDPAAAHGYVQAVETGNGILEMGLTPAEVANLSKAPVESALAVRIARIRAVFTSTDGQRTCEDEIRLRWEK
jgi:hypothetical protein